MSTEQEKEAANATPIKLSVCHEEQNFRLLELRSPLLELIESGQEPILKLKESSSPRGDIVGAGPPTSQGGRSVLCTETQTFEVHQVQSSNVLYILKASSNISNGNSTEAIDCSRITAIAQCKNLLQLSPVTASAVDHIIQVVPIFGGIVSRENVDSEKSLETLRSESPFSVKEFNAAWRSLCCFVMDNTAWRPSSTQLRNVWTSFLLASSITGLDISNTVSIEEAQTMLKDDNHMPEILVAVLSFLDPRDLEQIDEIQIDREKCVRWVAHNLLDVSGPNGIAKSQFLEQLMDDLPEKWREHVDLSMLQDCYAISPISERIVSKKFAPQQDSQSATAVPAVAKNKWHERFKQTQK